MVTKLNKPISREITLEDTHGNSGPVVVTMRADGLEFRRKGSSKKIMFLPWDKVTEKLALPSYAPARFASNPIGWLVETK